MSRIVVELYFVVLFSQAPGVAHSYTKWRLQGGDWLLLYWAWVLSLFTGKSLGVRGVWPGRTRGRPGRGTRAASLVGQSQEDYSSRMELRGSQLD